MRVGCWPTYEAMTKIAATILLYQKKNASIYSYHIIRHCQGKDKNLVLIL
jgi:hypothetical protein